MLPDAEDSSSSPEAGIDQDSEMMSHEKIERASSNDKSPTADEDTNTPPPTTKPNPKDPSRPRRKKARRACFACQRAHLTCGDERPCNRCVKRNIASSCADGVRKKAKYLHDAPADALNIRTVPNGNSTVVGGARASPNARHQGLPVSQAPKYFSVSSGAGYPQYTVAQQSSMGPPVIDTSTIGPEYNTNQNVDGQHRYSISGPHVTPSREISNTMDQPGIVTNNSNQSFNQAYLDPTTPDLYDMPFDVPNLNFGSTYATQEYSILSQMASGAHDITNMDTLNPMSHSNHNLGTFDQQFSTNFTYPPMQPNPWQMPGINSRTNSERSIWASQNTALDAFAIGEHPPSLTDSSPKSQSQDITGFQSTSPKASLTHHEHKQQQSDLFRFSIQQTTKTPFPGDPFTDSSRKRKRDTSKIYASVTKPYPYTAGFHAMTDFITKKFPRKKVLRIAKALATIRPSFIACNKNLTDDDLTFTERAFQRALSEYKEMMTQTSTPTIICRRTGEVAAVSKEFTLMTDWRKDVLLGEAPNLNINSSSRSSGSDTGASSRGAATPRITNVDVDPGRPQPVFLAELMDEESVVDFYEDFAEIAFGASRSSVLGEPCTLLKYRTKDDSLFGPNDSLADDGLRVRHLGNAKQDTHIRAESGMKTLGGNQGKIACSLCWTVKRDTFDMPLLIVMNFLPIIGS